jgi:hypothetical protein
MDAGVPISAPVAGAAMGLVLDGETGNFVVLTDILGKEDSIGDMDFKVTGTTKGITALQMDIKVKGIDERVIREGLKQALAARLFILDKMTSVLPSAREEMSDFAPRITTIKINPEKIREIIGKGGSMIRKIQEETQTEINVEDDGTVEIAAVSGDNARKAINWIESLTREVEIGSLYLGKVTRLMTFGAFVEILPKAARKRDGLPRRRQCREGRYPSGRRPGTLWWGSRKEARGSGETLSRTHFSGVRRNLSLRATESRKAAWRACSKGDRTGLKGFARRETDGRKPGSPGGKEPQTDGRRLAGKTFAGWSPVRRKDVRQTETGLASRKSEGMVRSLLRLSRIEPCRSLLWQNSIGNRPGSRDPGRNPRRGRWQHRPRFASAVPFISFICRHKLGIKEAYEMSRDDPRNYKVRLIV